MTPPRAQAAERALIDGLSALIGRRHVLCGSRRTRPYRTGYRGDEGAALAVARPANLVQLWRVLKASVDAGAAIIVQATNTGLTGGSTPDGDDYDRPVVIISTRRIRRIQLLETQAVCFAGATLADLQRQLTRQGREPHSVIGSSCIGASVIGGICNNSGGALVRRGPAFTRYALFAQVDAHGALNLVNHLGVRLPSDPEAALGLLDTRSLDAALVESVQRCGLQQGYEDQVRDIDASTPARFNADPRSLFEASGSAGKVVVFAVRVDTFATPKSTKTFYVGTNDPSELSTLRRTLLRSGKHLPISAEYIHRDAYRLSSQYGKDIFLAVKFLGCGRLQALSTTKSYVDGLLQSTLKRQLSMTDKFLQLLASMTPRHLPRRMDDMYENFEHHLIITTCDEGA